MSVEHATQPRLMPAKEAAQLVGYSADYVAKLAREGVVVGRQEGKFWMIDVDSLKLFSLRKAAEQRERQQQLRDERLRELAGKRVEEIARSVSEKQLATRPLALAVVAVLAFSSLVFTSLGAATYQAGVNTASISDGFSAVFAQLRSVLWWPAQQPEAAAESPQQTESDLGIVLVEDTFTAAELDLISRSFSDEVAITPYSSSTGVITPIFATGTASSFQYVLVPIVETATDEPTP